MPAIRSAAFAVSSLVIAGSMLPAFVTAASVKDALGESASAVGSFLSPFRKAEAQTLSAGASPNLQTILLPRAVMNVDPALARGGGDVLIDGSAVVAQEGPSGAGADIVYPKNSAISIYVVRDGDTLSEIATMFGVSVNTIVWANDLQRGSALKVGQTLVILPVSGVKHTVKKGDTLTSIAKRYNGDADDIKSFNAIETLVVGAEIIIPDGELTAAAPTTRPATVSGSSSAAEYTGYYLRPITGGRKTQGIHGYNGVDLAAPAGTPILAAASGEVIVSRQGGWNGGYGNYIVIRHDNGAQTLYAHNLSNIVGIGQRVVQGQVIGYVGSTGRSTGAHVHFEIRGGPRNPF